jgi:hypothetical protein
LMLMQQLLQHQQIVSSEQIEQFNSMVQQLERQRNVSTQSTLDGIRHRQRQLQQIQQMNGKQISALNDGPYIASAQPVAPFSLQLDAAPSSSAQLDATFSSSPQPNSLHFQPSATESSRLPPADLPRKPKRTRKKKGKGHPKQPLTAYNYFFQHQRAKLLEKELPAAAEQEPTASQRNSRHGRPRSKPHGRISFAELGTLIGKQWNDLGDEDKAIYQTKADRDKQRYFLEKQRYLEANTARSDGVEAEGETPSSDEDNTNRKRAADGDRDPKKRKKGEDEYAAP